MTQEDKELLLKDLCARLPYNVRVEYNGTTFTNIFDVLGIAHGRIVLCLPFMSKTECPLIEEVKPYLFPLSSMAEEQQEEFDRIYADDMQVVASNLKNRLDGKPYETNLGHYRHIDWLNANHFDYRGLIPKGLAIDATGLNIY